MQEVYYCKECFVATANCIVLLSLKIVAISKFYAIRNFSELRMRLF